jgi:hypothetical protein
MQIPDIDSSYHVDSGNQGLIRVMVDGGSTCAVLQEAKHCAGLRSVDISIKVGRNKGTSGIVKSSLVGDFSFTTGIDNHLTTRTILARIVPGFGINILPESLYLKQGFNTVKLDTEMTIYDNNNQPALRAHANTHDETWLYYAEVRPTNGGQTTINPILKQLRYLLPLLPLPTFLQHMYTWSQSQ